MSVKRLNEAVTVEKNGGTRKRKENKYIYVNELSNETGKDLFYINI